MQCVVQVTIIVKLFLVSSEALSIVNLKVFWFKKCFSLPEKNIFRKLRMSLASTFLKKICGLRGQWPTQIVTRFVLGFPFSPELNKCEIM